MNSPSAIWLLAVACAVLLAILGTFLLLLYHVDQSVPAYRDTVIYTSVSWAVGLVCMANLVDAHYAEALDDIRRLIDEINEQEREKP